MTCIVKNAKFIRRNSFRILGFLDCKNATPVTKNRPLTNKKQGLSTTLNDTCEVSDKELKQRVQWKDLLQYQLWETMKELSLPVPWLVLSVICSYVVLQENLHKGWYLLTLVASFYFFLTGLRVTHNAFHYCLGISRKSTDVVMFILSWLMLGSLHAVQYTHLQHHRHCLGDEDIEGSVAKYGFWEALIKGPLFPWRIHLAALKDANLKYKRWIYAELTMNVIWLSAVWLWLDVGVDSNNSFVMALKIHTGLMMVAYALSAFFAVWTVHHDTQNQHDEYDHWDNSRTMRSAWKSVLFYNMFYHIEHHLFPQIPTCHLPELARRLDAAGYNTHKKVI